MSLSLMISCFDLERCQLPLARIHLIPVYLPTEHPIHLALLSVYDKANLIELATALSQSGVHLLGSGGTAKRIRDAGLTIEWVPGCFSA
jgi:MGS-like domain